MLSWYFEIKGNAHPSTLPTNVNSSNRMAGIRIGIKFKRRVCNTRSGCANAKIDNMAMVTVDSPKQPSSLPPFGRTRYATDPDRAAPMTSCHMRVSTNDHPRNGGRCAKMGFVAIFRVRMDCTAGPSDRNAIKL